MKQQTGRIGPRTSPRWPGTAACRILLACLGTVLASAGEAGAASDAAAPSLALPTGRIAFASFDFGTRVGSLHVLLLDTMTVTLVKQAQGSAFHSLVWTPDGSRITYVASADAAVWRSQIFTIDVDGREVEPIYPSDGHNDFPAWSLDWRLAYLHGPGGGSGGPIWVNGSLFYSAYCDRSRPAWSPDGSALVVVLLPEGMWRVNTNNYLSTPLPPPPGGGWCTQPIYSPSGSRIAFVRQGGAAPAEQAEIWLMSPDGTHPVQVTRGYRDFYPTWSPDGQYIAFMRGFGTLQQGFYPWNIVITGADGSNPTVVIEDGSTPAWTR